ncbi:hypothetical protein GCM10010328_21180 [Streptomyces rubiginosohelvolus]|uniref:Uncharacterized protein n=1 Tax=Streptomyces rubiginosohelvolus TaxID=67362 RepID=A0ABQ3BI94_9ACTN|nr:hypothetical protein GCM10010328_21180 [Streptomyces pluricolorescens]
MTTARLNRDHNFWATEAIQPLDLGLGRVFDPIACRAPDLAGRPRGEQRGTWAGEAREEGTGNAGPSGRRGFGARARMKDSGHRSGCLRTGPDERLGPVP